MARGNLIAGIDIGSFKVRAIVGQVDEKGEIQVIGAGDVPSRGVRKGVITEVEETRAALSEALDKAERMAGITVRRAFFSIGGPFVNSQKTKGVIAVSRADGEISGQDIQRVVNAAEAVSLPANREILHTIPLQFAVDGEAGIRDPLGMSGIRLEVETLLIECSSPFLRNVEKCAEGADLQIEDIVLAPLAAASSSLSKRQKELGVALVDIGGGSTGLSVYEEGEIIHANVFPVGGSHITNDLAIGMRAPIDVAERVKVEYGSALPEEVGPKEMISSGKLGMEDDVKISRKEVAEIIQARVEEIFYLVNKDLKKIGRQALLPGGMVLVGGGAKLPGIADFAKSYFRLPSQIGFPQEVAGMVEKVDDPAYSTAMGLLTFARDTIGRHARGSYDTQVARSVSKLKKWFRGFLP